MDNSDKMAQLLTRIDQTLTKINYNLERILRLQLDAEAHFTTMETSIKNLEENAKAIIADVDKTL